jgi:membrane protein insertase Oxa1/YidC/SpoIIIJ
LFDILLPTRTAWWAVPPLAAGATFVQSRMMQQPTSPAPTGQELQTQQMTRTTRVTIAGLAILAPARLGLYWFVSNCFSIIQQYFVTGWGGLRPQAALVPAPAPAVQSASLSPKGTEEGY